MSSLERNKRSSHFPSWRSNEPSEGQGEGLRLRGPVVRPRDFVHEVQPVAAEQSVDTVKPAIPAHPEPPIAIEPKTEAALPPEVRPTVAGAIPAAEPVVVAPQVVSPAPVADAPLLDLHSAVRSIWAKKRLVLALAVAGAVLGAAAIPMLPQKFTAETSLYFDPRQTGGVDSSQSPPIAPELILTMIDSQTQILSSGKVLGRVVDALKLDQNPQFNGGASGDAAKYMAVTVLAKAVQIAREASTYVVSLKVTTRDAQKSAAIANQLVASFVEEEGKAAANSYQTSNTALDGRLEDLREQVRAAEKAAEAYRADNDMVAVGGNLMSDKRLTALNDMLVVAQQKTIEAKARADAADRLSFTDVVSNGPSATATAASTPLSSLRQQYAVLAANVGSLQSQLGARHPRLLAAKSSLDSLATEIRSELQRQTTSARADYDQAQKAEQDIAKELAVQKASQVNTSGKLVGLNELERKAAAARDAYQAVLKRSGQTSDARDLSQSNIRVISEAEPPLTADGPSRKVMMVAGLIAGALFGMGLGMAFAVLVGLFRHPVIRGYLGK
ncbi:Wzz/FepE/Etk N-terminal domain-containing protein [Agrobacterium sp. SHOUNA12C]|uniref:Succinoglycan biosynthesis transport protein n=2 Tax=Rhizobium rhizogenes TaxID=359 RepID=B9J6Z1_RHIR8|nr:GumC family protein [Rhizobium rhizogenes]ACM25097.1 succinoglycan biosynthesis transport protein [Rhizobium rhizogenes K84]KAA6487150.1 sugar transporter [Agrobacterium sp. ICMP 7243]MCJ9723831.1 Wzz/FepE/Etk N-terminal domain-containing protein [Agrobacterium sp. BETTINA12B]MCJ9760202.1 Wzz/FepE/Etk N-terminal domain-containing protein [Agrobacterium sp. SHOUNA12C]OCI97733.1 sugar transporter [Agrobacterium sp. 13-626]